MTTIPMLEKELKQANKDLYYYKNYSERLRNKLQQKENIIKEVRKLAEGRKERIEELSWVEMKADDYIEEQDELLEILCGDYK